MSYESIKLLLLDDDYNHLQHLKRYLTEIEGYEVTLTAQKNVVERLPTERFDLICVDVMIPPESLNEQDQVVQNIQFEGIPWQQTGLEFLRQLRAGEFSSNRDEGTPPGVPALILSAISGLPENGPVDSAWLKAQNIEQMEKPFDLEVIVNKISTLLQGGKP